jgi:hypothetical protein
VTPALIWPRAWRLVWHLTFILPLMAGFAGVRTVGAQPSVTIAAGTATSFQLPPSTQLTVPLILDMSSAGSGTVSSFSTGIQWNPAVLALDSVRATGFGAISPDLTRAPVGSVQLSVFASAPTAASQVVANVYFTTSGTSGGTVIQLSSPVARTSAGALALGQVLGRGVDVCVASQAIWGDANGDASVDIIDAQQIARSVVGLSVVSPSAVAEQGDVNADSLVNIIDAQLIARYAVDLSAPPRINTRQVTQQPVANVALSRSTVALPIRQTLGLIATPQDPSGLSLSGCAHVDWSSSDATKVTVNSSGVMRGVDAGSAVITATSGGISTQATITVSAPDATAALLRLRNLTSGGSATFTESVWLLGGLLTDEWKSSDTFPQRNGIDQRSIPDNDALVQSMLRELLRARSDALGARAALVSSGAPAANVAQMYTVIGYAELLLAETFCSGIPLAESSDGSGGLVVNGPPQTTETIYTWAVAHFDSAIALASGSDSFSSAMRNTASILKGRAYLQLGQFPAAAAAVTAVPTVFQDPASLSPGEANKIWLLNASQKRWTVGDSVDGTGVIGNALPFASAADPRLPVVGTSLGTSPAGTGFDALTNSVIQQLWPQTAAPPLASGVDARLIEAEVNVRIGNNAAALATLNALRASSPNLGGSFVTPPLPALASMPSPVDLFFREKAFWTFSRGQRLGDLRRLVRLYGRAANTVFPTGNFFKGGTYGSAVNFPVSVDEDGNALPTVCLDRNP